MDKITKLYPKGSAKNPDAVLEQAVGNYDNVLIIGWNKEGELDIRSDTGVGTADMLLMVDLFKFRLLDGKYSE